MESEGLKPLPTFHYGSPLEELDRIVEKYDYFALGGLVPLAMQKKKLRNWLDVCFSRIPKGKKVHGFGVNAIWAWERYPFYSTDATSWLSAGKYGDISELRGNKMVRKAGTKGLHYDEKNKEYIKQLLIARDYVTRLWEERGIVWK